MPDRNHAGYCAYLERVGRPVVTEHERARVRELRAEGLTLQAIAEKLGRVKSTIHCILRSQARSSERSGPKVR